MSPLPGKLALWLRPLRPKLAPTSYSPRWVCTDGEVFTARSVITPLDLCLGERLTTECDDRGNALFFAERQRVSGFGRGTAAVSTSRTLEANVIARIFYCNSETWTACSLTNIRESVS